MLRLGLRLTVSLAAILVFLALAPGHKASASTDLNGSWATVYSRDLPSVANAGDCEITLLQSGPPGHYGSLPGGFCETNGVQTLSNGVFNLTLSGLSFSGTSVNTTPFPNVISFTGTVAGDLNSANGTWWATAGPVAGPCCGFQSGTFVSARSQTTTGTAGQTITYPTVGNGASITFGGAGGPGQTTIEAAATADAALPPQFQLVGQFYHVVTTAPHGPPGPYIFCANYPGTTGVTDVVSGILETDLHILHLDAGVWSEEARYDGTPIPPGTDPVNLPNKVCASVDHLSQFALVGPVISVTPSPTPTPSPSPSPTPNPVGGLVSIVGGDSSSGVSTWLWPATAAVAIALATAGGWVARGRRRLR